jgi:hypothetical protein
MQRFPISMGEGARAPQRRDVPFDVEPGYYQPAALWLYGNVRLLDSQLDYVAGAFGPDDQAPDELNEIEAEAERLVLGGKTLVCGIHNSAHQRAAVVPLRWGAPRVVVMSGGFYYHLGLQLEQEPFRAARLWRYAWDPKVDLAISRRAPDKLPTFARHNATIDRLIAIVAEREHLDLGSVTACLSALDNPLQL